MPSFAGATAGVDACGSGVGMSRLGCRLRVWRSVQLRYWTALSRAGLWHLMVCASCRHVRTFSRSEEHTSELQSLMRISYAVFCLKKKKLLTSCNAVSTSTQKPRNRHKQHDHKK